MYGMAKNSFSTTAKKVTTANQTHHELLQNHLKSHQRPLPPSKIGEVTIFFFSAFGQTTLPLQPLVQDQHSATPLLTIDPQSLSQKNINIMWGLNISTCAFIFFVGSLKKAEFVSFIVLWMKWWLMFLLKHYPLPKSSFFFANELGLMTAWRGVLECRGAISHKAWVWLSCISILVPHTSFGTIWDSLYYAFSVCLSTIDY